MIRNDMVFVMVLCITPFLSADTIHVPKDHPTIQAAIDAANVGDEILVAPGTYVENLDFRGKDLVVASTGGAHVTVVDGSGFPWPVAIFRSKETPKAKLAGFTLTGGKGVDHESFPGIFHRCGGGVYVYKAGVTLEDCRITGNTLDDKTAYGAGIFCEESDLHMVRCEISDNVIHATSFGCGGGVYLDEGTGIFERSRITGNRIVTGNNCTTYGCGLYTAYSSAILHHDVFLDNRIEGPGFGSGGGLRFYKSQFTLVNALVARNSIETGRAGAMEVFSCTEAKMLSCTVAGNQRPTSYPDGAIYVFDSDLYARNGIHWNPDYRYEFHLRMAGGSITGLDLAHCDVRHGQKGVFAEPGSTLDWGTGMIDALPGFAAPDLDDYHLTWTSPCRDAGGVECGSDEDFEGDPRSIPTADQGADEFHPHLYTRGDAAPGDAARFAVTAAPGTSPVILMAGSGLLHPPMVMKPFGLFHLEAPLIFITDLGTVASPLGIETFRFRVPPNVTTPLETPFQALLGNDLSNPYMLLVR